MAGKMVHSSEEHPTSPTIEQLIEENKALKSEIERLRSIVASYDPINEGTASSAPGHFRFMDLPEGIRLQIYEYLVVPGLVCPQWTPDLHLYDCRYKDISKQRPAETQIFLVSNSVMDEALPLYLSKNHFIMPAVGQWYKPMSRFLGSKFKFKGHPGYASKYIRSLSFAFDFRACGEHDLIVSIVDDAMTTPAESYWLTCDNRERQEHVHEMMQEELLNQWVDMTGALHELRLDYLQLDVSHCFCAMTCCRHLDYVLNLFFFSSTQWTHAPKCIEIMGTRDAKELAAVKSQILRIKGLKTVELRFK